MVGVGYRFVDGNYIILERQGRGRSVSTISNARAQQRAAIESVESVEVALKQISKKVTTVK